MNKPGIRADPLLGALPLDGQRLLVRYSAPWMLTARGERGQKEVPGVEGANPRILEYFTATPVPHSDDSGETDAWCAAFVSWVMKQHGYDPPARPSRALAWESFGQAITDPVYGAIGIKSRDGGGHVAFVVGKSADGKQLYMLGGNQRNSASIAQYERSKWHSFVFPPGCSASAESLPVYKGDAAAAGSEA